MSNDDDTPTSMPVIPLLRVALPSDEEPTRPNNEMAPADSTPIVLPQEQDRWRRVTEFHRLLETEVPALLQPFSFVVHSYYEENQAKHADFMQKLNLLQDDLNRLQVQLASCSSAAMGFSRDIKRTAYAWSQAYEDVKRLRVEMERLRNANAPIR